MICSESCLHFGINFEKITIGRYKMNRIVAFVVERSMHVSYTIKQEA